MKWPVSISKGFTLIEVMVATAILMLVMVVALNIIGSATSLSSEATKRVGIRDEARILFDRIGLDVSSLASFDAYQIQFTSNNMGLISRSDSEGDRLQRADYWSEKVNGASRLIRSVRSIGWTNDQTMAVPKATNSEVLSKNSAEIKLLAVMSDGTYASTLNMPSTRVDLRPVGMLVAIALMDATVQSSRGIGGPTITFQTNSETFRLSEADERAGWRLYQRNFPIP